MSKVAAALGRFAAMCGLLVVPGVATAQLRCPDDGSAPRIRSVSFEGNRSFTGRELSLHVVATETDKTAQVLGKRAMLYGAGVGAAVGLLSREEDQWKGGLLGAALGTFAGLIIGSSSGVERCLRQGLLVGDMSSLRGFYGDNGFPDTRVDTATTIDGEWVDIVFRITEGAPVLIDSVNIPLDSALADLADKLNSRKGERFSPDLLAEDIDSIETRLRNSGYPEARALRNVTLPTPHTAIVGLTIDRGPRARIGRITILPSAVDNGVPVVDTQAIRDLLLFQTGDEYSERVLFESERRFYRVGSFLSTEIAPDASHVYEDSTVDVTVRVVEDLTRTFSVEPGFGTLDCLRGRVEYSDRAFRGGLNRVDVSASVSKLGRARRWPGVFEACELQQDEEDISSTEINYNGTIRYTRPTPLRGGLLPSVSAYTERRGGFQAYLRTTLIGGALSVSKNITRTIFWESSYTLEYGETIASEPVLCFVFQACDASARDQLIGGNSRLAVVGMRLSRDRRNFADSASAGTFARMDLRAADPLVSDASLRFQKAVGDIGGYRRVLGNAVVAARFRAGAVRGGQSAGTGRLPPPQERLYTGGETTVRGFGQNELGSLIYITEADLDTLSLNALPPATRDSVLQAQRMRTIPTGGNAMAVGNLELRLPGPFLRTLQTIVFLDVGALSTEGFQAIGEKQARWTPGVAVRYFSPIGPIQFNLGYNDYPYVAGPVYLNQGPGAQTSSLKCLTGTDDGVCQPAAARAPKTTFWKKLTFTIAFPPDF